MAMIVQVAMGAVLLVSAGWGVHDGQAWLERREQTKHWKD